jgi:hypothetical protein
MGISSVRKTEAPDQSHEGSGCEFLLVVVLEREKRARFTKESKIIIYMHSWHAISVGWSHRDLSTFICDDNKKRMVVQACLAFLFLHSFKPFSNLARSNPSDASINVTPNRTR